MDLTQHNALNHKQGHCIICNAQKFGDNRLNDHTKMCREKRDLKRAENYKKDKERAEEKNHKTKKHVHHTYGRRYKKQRNRARRIVKKRHKKGRKRKQKIQDGIPEGVPKIKEIYRTKN